MAEAGGVCLEWQGHAVGVQLAVRGSAHGSHELRWPGITDQTRRGWADLQEATEWGATGIAVLLAKEETGHAVVSRSVKGTGFDYWLGDESDVFQEKARLEVSGILHGDDKAFSARVREKIRQTHRSDSSGRPAYVIVVEFSQPAAHFQGTAP